MGYSQHDAYVIQKVISGLQSSESLDAYVFCRKMMLDSLQAVLVLKMTDDYVEFSLAEHKGGSEGLASAKVYLEGFEIFTRSTTVSWLKYLAANQEVLHKGMHGNVSLRLTGRLRPVKRKGFWKVETRFERSFFASISCSGADLRQYGQLRGGVSRCGVLRIEISLSRGGSTLLNRAISTFGSTLVLNQILELVRRSVPAKLLDVMTKLHSTGPPHGMSARGAEGRTSKLASPWWRSSSTLTRSSSLRAPWASSWAFARTRCWMWWRAMRLAWASRWRRS